MQGSLHKSHMNSDQQDEADIKLILHAADAITCGATSIGICLPDTEVADLLVLAICYYSALCRNTLNHRDR